MTVYSEEPTCPFDGDRTPIASTKAGQRPVDVAIVEALADAKGVSPTQFGETLYEHVDPDALSRLVGENRPGTDLRVTFSVAAYTVTVRSDRRIYVYARR